MSLSRYRVEFYVGIPGVGPFTFVEAEGSEEACILAQAERIKARYGYSVSGCLYLGEVMSASGDAFQ